MTMSNASRPPPDNTSSPRRAPDIPFPMITSFRFCDTAHPPENSRVGAEFILHVKNKFGAYVARSHRFRASQRDFHVSSFSTLTAQTLNSGMRLTGSSAALVRRLTDCSSPQWNGTKTVSSRAQGVTFTLKVAPPRRLTRLIVSPSRNPYAEAARG